MFVATPGNQVLAIDAKKGDLLWRFKRPMPEDILLLHPTSRGGGVLGDKGYFSAADAVLVALDAKTVWEEGGRYLCDGCGVRNHWWPRPVDRLRHLAAQ